MKVIFDQLADDTELVFHSSIFTNQDTVILNVIPENILDVIDCILVEVPAGTKIDIFEDTMKDNSRRIVRLIRDDKTYIGYTIRDHLDICV